MDSFNLIKLPTELFYVIFGYIRKSDVIYAFYELDERFAAAVRFFIGNSINLTNVSPPVSIYILSKFGPQLCRLAIGGQSFNFSTARDCLIKYCVNVETLDIFCTAACHDIRDYLQFVHWNLESFSITDKQVRSKSINNKFLSNMFVMAAYIRKSRVNTLNCFISCR